MRAYIFALILIVPPVQGGLSEFYGDVEQLELYPRSTVEQKELDLVPHERTWLKEKGRLVLGVSKPDYRPFDITINDSKYEGVTADISGALSKLLNIDFVIRSFADRDSAIAALKSGTIDMLASANGYDVTDPQLVLSKPYAPDQPILFSRLNDVRKFQGDLTGVRVAVTNDYITHDVIVNDFNGALVELYTSREKALAALAFGRVDLYLGDALSSNLLINENYFNYVKVERFVDINTRGTSYALRKDNNALRHILDTAIAAIDSHEYDEILRRWAGGIGALKGKNVSLTESEKDWIARNPIVHIAVSAGQAPIAFIDTEGSFSGIASDILKIVSFDTGIKFEPVYYDKVSDLQRAILTGESDLACLTKTTAREARFRFTETFAFSPFAIMTGKADRNLVSIQQLRGQRVAIPKGHVVAEFLHGEFPDIKVKETSNLLEAMSLVSEGKAIATIAPLSIARFYSERMSGYKIFINNIVDEDGARFSFAMQRADQDLQSILNKVLAVIPPDELIVISNRWRANPAVQINSWKDYSSIILQIVGVAALLLGVSLVWNIYLRRQVAQRNQARKELDEQLGFMQSLINGTPHPIYVRDREGRLLSCNTYYLQAINRRFDELKGKRSFEGSKIDALQAHELHADYMEVIRSGKPIETDRPLQVKDRATTIYHWIYPYKDSSGEVQGVICGWIDISERRKLIEEIAAARDQADAASRAKTTFLATMSHEIRTPMNAIIGLLELNLRGSSKETPGRSLIEVAYDSAISLLELIGDILDIVRIESGNLSLSSRRADLRELSESVVRVFDGLARQKGLTLNIAFHGALGGEVLIDPVRYKQILSNLVGNAIKFTDSGGVRIGVSGKQTPQGQLQVEVLVEDSGIGISPADQANVFRPFEQVATQEHNVRGGAGLGLAICRSLAEMMGGTLSLESQLGVGTRVRLQLALSPLEPLAACERDQGKHIDAAKSYRPNLKILVVDDNSANRLVLSQQFTYLGHRVTSACDGVEALQAWTAGDFDLVVTDCNMPLMSGYELAGKLRQAQAGNSAPRTVILGFTANAQADEVQKCVAAGMDDCLFKPVTIDDLEQRLRRWFGMPDDLTAVAPETPALGFHPGLDSSAGEATFQLASLIEISKTDDDALKQMLQEFLRSNRMDLELLSAYTLEDVQGVAQTAHKIKGGAKVLHAHRLISACEAVEHCSQLPAVNSGEVKNAVERLKQEMLCLEQDLVKTLARL